MHTRSIGNKGENIACEFLKKHGFLILCRNYQRKWGEIDIIAKYSSLETLHFFEVKSVTKQGVSYLDFHKPEDNVHGLKARHIGRMIETYLYENFGLADRPFEFHVLCVYMDMRSRKANVKWIKNVIL